MCMYVCLDERGGEKLSLSRFPVPCYSANWFTKDRLFYCGYGNPFKEYWPAFFFFFLLIAAVQKPERVTRLNNEFFQREIS